MKSSISLREVVAQLVAELGEQPLVGHDGVELVDVEPAQREAGDERLGARIGEHALDLRFDDVGTPELARCRELQAALRRARGSRGRTTSARPARSRRARTSRRYRARTAQSRDTGNPGSRARPSRAARCRCRSRPPRGRSRRTASAARGRRRPRAGGTRASRASCDELGARPLIGGRCRRDRRRSCRGSPCATGLSCRTALRLRCCR